MKTAMQELLDELKEYQLEFNIPIEVIDMCESQLNVEKEQIMNAYVKGFDISAEGWNGEYGIKDFNNIKEEIKAEEYYNQTYNQNK